MRFNKEHCASPVRYLLIFAIFQSLVNSNLCTHTAESEMCLKILISCAPLLSHSCASRHHISSDINFLAAARQSEESIIRVNFLSTHLWTLQRSQSCSQVCVINIGASREGFYYEVLTLIFYCRNKIIFA